MKLANPVTGVRLITSCPVRLLVFRRLEDSLDMHFRQWLAPYSDRIMDRIRNYQ
jgi:hypothetical protein